MTRIPLPQRVLTGRFEIGRSPIEVFEFLAHLPNWRRIDDTVVDLQPATGLGPRVELGSLGTVTSRTPGGFKARMTWEITEFAAGSRFTNRIVGRGYELTETVDLAASPSGTTATVSDTLIATSRVGRLMVPLSGGFMRRDLEKRSAKLKMLLETDAR
jgi:hypothetical protein